VQGLISHLACECIFSTHPETKGTQGWQMPTRRSVTWLVYLNDGWTADEGGALRCFPRKLQSTVPVGAHEGNLQIGWIDNVEPVFLDAWRPSGQTALYKFDEKASTKQYISKTDFDVPRQPIEFQKFLSPRYQKRFSQISTARLDPRFAGGGGTVLVVADANSDKEEHTLDVVPAAGTLVLFDSVSLPHLVQEVTGSRRRVAATGWFHEDSQSLLS
jgi:2OG-Fe(II) oxygenase superfamily